MGMAYGALNPKHYYDHIKTGCPLKEKTLTGIIVHQIAVGFQWESKQETHQEMYLLPLMEQRKLNLSGQDVAVLMLAY